jgi:hypothetical protein
MLHYCTQLQFWCITMEHKWENIGGFVLRSETLRTIHAKCIAGPTAKVPGAYANHTA